MLLTCSPGVGRRAGEHGTTIGDPGLTSSDARPGVQGHADDAESGSRATRSARAAFLTLVVALVVAVPVLLHLGRDRWFRYDDWDFLAARSATDLHSLFTPHNVHWSTLPILLYRGLWTAFGIRSYLPYELAAILSHVVVVSLLWVVMRKATVRPWTATAACVLLLFLGSGDENILWSFGVTFTAAIALGLAQLVLSSHDGPLDRRDWWGLAAGLAALLCSGVAVTMVFVVALAMLIRRGWRVAAFHAAPLAAVFLVWFVAFGRDAVSAPAHSESPLEFARSAVVIASGRVFQIPGSGWLLGVVLVVGCVLAWRSHDLTDLRRTAAAPASLLVGALLFLLIAGFGTAAGGPTSTRYTYVGVALALPAIAVAADALMTRYRVTIPILVVLLVAGFVGNVRRFDDAGQRRAAVFQRAYREQLFTFPRLPLASRMPRSFRPDTALAPSVTLGWLRDGAASGQIPKPTDATPTQRATAQLLLVLRRVPTYDGRACRTQRVGSRLTLERGGSIALTGPIVLRSSSEVGTSIALPFAPSPSARYLVAYAGPLNVEVVSAPGGAVTVCATGSGALPGIGGAGS